jgi:hypothetical protein
MAKDIKFDIEARDGLKRGVDALANAVKVTLDQREEMLLFLNLLEDQQSLRMEFL